MTSPEDKSQNIVKASTACNYEYGVVVQSIFKFLPNEMKNFDIAKIIIDWMNASRIKKK